jgi:hypothetical protein
VSIRAKFRNGNTPFGATDVCTDSLEVAKYFLHSSSLLGTADLRKRGVLLAQRPGAGSGGTKRRPETDGAPCVRPVRDGFGSRVGAGGGIGHSAVGADETGERLRLRAGRAFRWVGGPRSKTSSNKEL